MIKYHFSKSLNHFDENSIENLFNKLIQECKRSISKTENIDLDASFELYREFYGVSHNGFIGKLLEFFIKKEGQIIGFISAFKPDNNKFILVYSH